MFAQKNRYVSFIVLKNTWSFLLLMVFLFIIYLSLNWYIFIKIYFYRDIAMAELKDILKDIGEIRV